MSDKPNPEPIEPENSAQQGTLEEAMVSIHEALAGLRYGHVTVIVHNGAIVQIERLEKKRLRAD